MFGEAERPFYSLGYGEKKKRSRRNYYVVWVTSSATRVRGSNEVSGEKKNAKEGGKGPAGRESEVQLYSEGDKKKKEEIRLQKKSRRGQGGKS